MKRGQETNHIWKQEAGTQDTQDRGLTAVKTTLYLKRQIYYYLLKHLIIHMSHWCLDPDDCCLMRLCFIYLCEVSCIFNHTPCTSLCASTC